MTVRSILGEATAMSDYAPTLSTLDDLRAASQEVMLLLDARGFNEAVSFADSATGQERFVRHLRALSYTHAGRELDDEGLLRTAISLWEEAVAEPKSRDHYNLANAELNPWELKVKANGYVSALEGDRAHLHRGRALYADIGRDSKLPDGVRVQALTNLGNSFDIVGRSVDGVDAYQEALALDPTFGMALGNKGVALLGIAPLMQGHVAAGVVEARDDLDAALKDRERILQIGGPAALEHFQRCRTRITVTTHHQHNGPTRIGAGAPSTTSFCTFRQGASTRTATPSTRCSSEALPSGWGTRSSDASTTCSMRSTRSSRTMRRRGTCSGWSRAMPARSASTPQP